jgi:hypothetical protein
VLFAGCARPAPIVLENRGGGRMSASAVLATMHRAPCYGPCPVYSVAVHDDGTVDWEGQQHVKVVGKARGSITPAQVDDLRHAFADARFDTLEDYTREDSTDAASIELTFRYPWGMKRVVHYQGDDGAPRALDLLENTFDRIVGSERWKGGEEEQQWPD